MSLDYTEHYNLAKIRYADNNSVSSKYTIDDINVTIVNPYKKDQAIDLPDNYLSLVDTISEKVKSKFANKKCCFFPPGVEPNKDVLLRLKDSECLGVDGVEQICQIILPQLESKYFQSYLHVEKVYFYRNIITDNPPRHSWLWHYDNHPKEIHKVIIYLNDVDEDSGPFEFLRSAEGKAIIIPPSRTGKNHWGSPRWPNSRVPLDVIEKYKNKGYKSVKAVGKKGTVLMFDNNCIHKANIGKSGYRDALALQIRPALEQLKPYISPKWTGGFEANDISKDPSVIKPCGKWCRA